MIRQSLLLLLCTILLAIPIFGATINVTTNKEIIYSDNQTCFMNMTSLEPCEYGYGYEEGCKSWWQRDPTDECVLGNAWGYTFVEGDAITSNQSSINATASEIWYLPYNLTNLTFWFVGFGYYGAGCSMSDGLDCMNDYYYKNQSSGDWILAYQQSDWHTMTERKLVIPIKDLEVIGNGSVFEYYINQKGGVWGLFGGAKINYTFISGTCTNNWTCSESYCHAVTKTTVCTEVTDLNGCGNPFDEDYTQFSEPCETLFVADDIHIIGFDVLGEAGVQLKVNIPLIILGIISLGASAIYVAIKSKI